MKWKFEVEVKWYCKLKKQTTENNMYKQNNKKYAGALFSLF